MTARRATTNCESNSVASSATAGRRGHSPNHSWRLHFPKRNGRASGPPALSNLGQALALPHDLSFFDEIDPIMGVDSAVAVPVTDDHDITVAAQHIAEDDLSVRSGYDRGAARGSNVDTIVETAVPWAKA